ncbi:hypothetical protein NEIRO03_2130 [Nematocida sp. AWRm78]|nr:hypothetical protein NEIRO02_2095 [Nematocida sp. AWRm79]KAI5185844.1 hypothetical protein NEIRO03_2130 [Nematocida sp. AWRm78]
MNRRLERGIAIDRGTAEATVINISSDDPNYMGVSNPHNLYENQQCIKLQNRRPNGNIPLNARTKELNMQQNKPSKILCFHPAHFYMIIVVFIIVAAVIFILVKKTDLIIPQDS